MTPMPQHIKDAIEEKYKDTSSGQIKIEAAQFGYSLAQGEIERLTGLLKKEFSPFRTLYTSERWKQFCTENNIKL